MELSGSQAFDVSGGTQQLFAYEDTDHVLTIERQFSSLVKNDKRSRDGEHLSELTHRNQKINTLSSFKAAENFKQYQRQHKFEESKLLWEVDEEKRRILCKEYDDIKEGTAKAEDLVPGVKPAAAQTANSGPQQSQEEKAVEDAVNIFKQRQGSLSDVEGFSGTPEIRQPIANLRRMPSRVRPSSV